MVTHQSLQVLCFLLHRVSCLSSCGVSHNTVLNLPHLLSTTPQHATPASALVSALSPESTLSSISHTQPLPAFWPAQFLPSRTKPNVNFHEDCLKQRSLYWSLLWIALMRLSLWYLGDKAVSTRILKCRCRQVGRCVCMNWKDVAQNNRSGAPDKDMSKLESRKTDSSASPWALGEGEMLGAS